MKRKRVREKEEDVRARLIEKREERAPARARARRGNLSISTSLSFHSFTSGFSRCRRSARALSGWDWMDRAVPTDRTLNRKGRTGPKRAAERAPRAAGWASSQAPSVPPGAAASSDGPDGWVPIHSSAYGAAGSMGVPPAAARAATCGGSVKKEW
jgi:hypothetical protein